MTKQDRLQLNIRLDGHGELLDTARQCASSQGISLNTFVINAIKSAVGMSLDKVLDNALDSQLDTILDRLLDSDRLREYVGVGYSQAIANLNATKRELQDELAQLKNEIEIIKVSPTATTKTAPRGGKYLTKK